jgi:hypothetical protein
MRTSHRYSSCADSYCLFRQESWNSTAREKWKPNATHLTLIHPNNAACSTAVVRSFSRNCSPGPDQSSSLSSSSSSAPSLPSSPSSSPSPSSPAFGFMGTPACTAEVAVKPRNAGSCFCSRAQSAGVKFQESRPSLAAPRPSIRAIMCRFPHRAATWIAECHKSILGF